MTWKLQTVNGEFTGTEITINGDMLVGRHQEADIVLAAAEISRRHAAFLLKEQALYVQDLKSSNGTFVNDIRVDNEALLKDGDIVQFASLKFAVLAPAVVSEPVSAVEPTPAVVSSTSTIVQPPEAVAVSELAQEQLVESAVEEAPVEKSEAQKMNDQGMPDLKERDSSVQLSREGMPQNVGIPKPAPIPEGVDVTKPVIPEACEVEIPATCVNEEAETQKNASIGLMAILAIAFVVIIAWFIFN